jgi:hypothetical protein
MSSEPSGAPTGQGLAETGTSSGHAHGLRAGALRAGDVVIQPRRHGRARAGRVAVTAVSLAGAASP